MEEKERLRAEMKVHRSTLTEDFIKEYSRKIAEEIGTIFKSMNGQTLHTYLPLVTEIDTWPLIRKTWELGKKVVVPKTLPHRTMKHLQLLPSSQLLVKGRFNTLHPANEVVYEGNYSVIVVPGLAFDHQGYRLGYGAGYYDAFLNAHPEALKIGVAYPFSYRKEVPREPHDAKVDQVIYFTDDFD